MTNRRAAVLRGLMLAIVIAIWLGISGVGGSTMGKLAQVSTNDQSTFLPASAESVRANEALREFDDSGALPAFLLLMGDEPLAQAFGADAGAPGGPATGGPPSGGPPPGVPTEGGAGGPGAGGPGADYALGIHEQIEVEGAGTVADLLAANQPPVAVPANDGSGLLLIVPLDNAKVNEVAANDESYLINAVDAIRAEAQGLTGADEIYVTGPAGYAVDLGSAFAGIDGTLLIVTLSVVLLILLLVYRSVVLPIMVLFSAVSALALAGFIVYHLAKNGTIVLNGQSQGILSILVIGAATDYALLIVARYREELGRHSSTWEAMKRTWRACVEPIVASAATVTVGLLCLLLSDLNSNRGLGPVGAIGIAASVLAALTLLPALLLLGRCVVWPRIPRVAASSSAGTAPEAGASPARDDRSGFWWRVAHFVERRPRRVWMSVAAGLLLFCLAVPLFRAGGTPDDEVFFNEVQAVTGQQVLEDHFDAGAADPLRIVATADTAPQIAESLEDDERISTVNVLDNEVDGRVEIEVVPADPDGAGELVEPVREVAHAADPDSLVGGNAAVTVDTVDTSRTDLIVIIPVVLLAVLVLLMLLLRAVVAPVLLVIATAISFGTAMGVSALLFNYVFDMPGSDPAVPLIGFVFLVALGVDYSIFLMSRAREEVAKHGPTDGVTKALAVTGGVITSAGIVLAATFSALAVIPLLFMAQLAFVVAFGVLLDTLIVRSLLVPALAIDLGRRTWWPSKLSRADATATGDRGADDTDSDLADSDTAAPATT